MDTATVIRNFLEAMERTADAGLQARLTQALERHDAVANFGTVAFDYGVLGFDDSGATAYLLDDGDLSTQHLGPGLTWSETVKSFEVQHRDLPEGHIQVDARDMTEQERGELRDALGRLG